MNFDKAQLDLYKKYYNNGNYNIRCTSEILKLIRTHGYLEFLHEKILAQLQDITIDSLNFDKINILLPATRHAAKNIHSAFLKGFEKESTVIYKTKIKKGSYNKLYFEKFITIKWKKTKEKIHLFFIQSDRSNDTNIKVEFNFTKARANALEVLTFIFYNLPQSKAVDIFHNAKINRLERYFTLEDIPTWTALIARVTEIKNSPSYTARMQNNGIASNYYISKENSKEIIVYDKYAKDTLYDSTEYFTGDLPDKPKNTKIHYIETKIECRNMRNKMNEANRKNKLIFSAPSTFPSFLHSLQIYSPLLYKELNDEQASHLIRVGFYNFIIDMRKDFRFELCRIIESYRLQWTDSSRKIIETNFLIIFDQFLIDLSKLCGQFIINPDIPFAKKRRKIRSATDI